MKAFLERMLVACFVALLCVSPARAQEALSDAKRTDIARLIQVTGSGQIGLQFGEIMVKAITDNMKATRPDIPPRVSEIVRDEVTKLLQQRVGSLFDLLVPVYHTYFTHEEIKGLLQFYASPLGKKIIQVMPKVTQESMAVGQQWGESLGKVVQERLRKRLEAEGFK